MNLHPHCIPCSRCVQVSLASTTESSYGSQWQYDLLLSLPQRHVQNQRSPVLWGKSETHHQQRNWPIEILILNIIIKLIGNEWPAREEKCITLLSLYTYLLEPLLAYSSNQMRYSCCLKSVMSSGDRCFSTRYLWAICHCNIQLLQYQEWMFT